MTSEVDVKINSELLRKQFPNLNRKVNGKPLVYFDNGATAQKPQTVIDSINAFYTEYNANIHRAVHTLSQEATEAYEAARKKVRDFINAADGTEIIFTKGTTEGINLLASCFSDSVQQGDEILISAMEHHSNIVPWQILCEKTGAVLKVIPVSEKGELVLDELDQLLSEKTKILSLTHVSNTLGTINPVKAIIKKARSFSSAVILDGAQAVPHMSVDVQDLDCDFYVFSGHKMYAPTGIGILYGKKEWLEKLPPYQGGGDMIKSVSFEKTEYNELPFKFEAGTPHISGAIGLGAAIDFIIKTGQEVIERHEKELLQYATQKLKSVQGLKIYGESDQKASVISFLVEGIHPYDLGMILDKLGIAIRTGHHCTQPLMDFYQIPGTCRASLSFYNTFEEIDILAEGINKAIKMLK